MANTQTPHGFQPFEFEQVYSISNGKRIKSRSSYASLVTSKDSIVWAEDTGDKRRAVFKLYHHRGPISWWREKFFRFRVQREFDALCYLFQNGVPCPRPHYWSYGYLPGLGRCELLVTSEVPDSITFAEFLQSSEGANQASNVCALFRLIRKMHRSGFYHGALWARNVLVTTPDLRDVSFHIIDTPSSMRFSKDLYGTRMAWADLLNISTSLRKLFGADSCEQYLIEYGLSERLIERFKTHLIRYSPSRHTRNRLRAEFEVRELVSHFCSWCTGIHRIKAAKPLHRKASNPICSE